MALTGKCLEVNAALRAAAGAVKMMSLSEGVVCPYTIDEEQFKNQCSADFDPNLPKTTSIEEIRRVYVFFKAIQQGVQPPTNIARLPEAEEHAFADEIEQAYEDFKLLPAKSDYGFQDYFFSNILKISTGKIKHIGEHFKVFIRPEGEGKPILAHNCGKKVENYVDDLRIIEQLKYGRIYMQQAAENSDTLSKDSIAEYVRTHGFQPTALVAINATNDINKIIIKIINDHTDIIKGFGSIIKFDPIEIDIIPLNEVYYIKIKDAKNVDIPVIGVSNMRTQSVVKYVFDHDLVVDVQPYLMYLLQSDAWASNAFMAASFGGNMKPPTKYPLAFYIIAQYIANRPRYVANPADFYRKPDKNPEIIEALKNNYKDSKSELRIKITEGYAWLKEKPPTYDDLIIGFGSQAILTDIIRSVSAARKKRGGTRKVRFARSTI
jgi:hypothetical protein